MKKYFFLVLIFVFVIILLGMIALNEMNGEKDLVELNGTYLCADLPFASMTFDENDAFSFYFYNYYETTDLGSYAKKTNNVYVINSGNLRNVEITCKKDWFTGTISFTIDLDDKEYVFERSSDIPIVQLNTDGS